MEGPTNRLHGHYMKILGQIFDVCPLIGGPTYRLPGLSLGYHLSFKGGLDSMFKAFIATINRVVGTVLSSPNSLIPSILHIVRKRK